MTNYRTRVCIIVHHKWYQYLQLYQLSHSLHKGKCTSRYKFILLCLTFSSTKKLCMNVVSQNLNFFLLKYSNSYLLCGNWYCMISDHLRLINTLCTQSKLTPD